ncbi:MAG: RDD family protein [Planctomycetota bacterium]|jgi:uncharacterized RDD family membrane protein YckC
MADKIDQFDTSIEIVTPENIAFQYRVAGPFRRLPAYLIDLLVRVLIIGVGSFVFGIIAGFALLGPWWWIGGSLVWLFIVTWFYGGLFETLWNGQTPGKRMMQIRVLSTDGQPINGVQAVLRNWLRALDLFPVCYLLGLLVALMNNRFQRLGDWASGTMVVVEERQWLYGRGLIRTGEPEVLRIADQIPANFQASRSLARALAAYVQRRGMFSWGRRLEIARHLGEPLREKFNLPPGTNVDLLLCALYHRTFITERHDKVPQEGSPFMEPHAAFARFADPQPQVAGAAAGKNWGQ